jgi:hypothetical protein
VSGQQRKISHKAPSDQTHIYFTDIPLPAPREMPVAHSNLIKVRPPTRAGQLMASMEIAIYYTKTWASPSLFSQNVRELLALGRAVRAARAGKPRAGVAHLYACSGQSAHVRNWVWGRCVGWQGPTCSRMFRACVRHLCGPVRSCGLQRQHSSVG